MTAQPLQELLLAAASRIATRLCDAALWNDGEACTWLQSTLVTKDANTRSETLPMTASLYNGTAGVALFLAEIAALTGSTRFAETAAGAARHAHRAPPALPDLHGGQTGVAFSLLRVSECLGDRRLRQEFEDRLAALERLLGLGPARGLDVMTGCAGIILGLLNIHRRVPERSLLDAARRQAWHLCERAEWTEHCCNWTADSQRPELVGVRLSGLSHGSSGIGAALLAVAAKTGEEKFLLTGRGAFSYDDTLFRDEQRLWIDKRSHNSDSRNVAEAWCHGAAGIALARIIAAESDPVFRAQHEYYAAVAARGTERNLHDFWMGPHGNCCLCHGALGACDVLVTADRHGVGPGLAESARKVARELVRRHDESGEWPSNANFSGPHLGLLMGQAGMGHGLLRIAYPDKVESVLMIR